MPKTHRDKFLTEKHILVEIFHQTGIDLQLGREVYPIKGPHDYNTLYVLNNKEWQPVYKQKISYAKNSTSNNLEPKES